MKSAIVLTLLVLFVFYAGLHTIAAFTMLNYLNVMGTIPAMTLDAGLCALIIGFSALGVWLGVRLMGARRKR